MLHWTWFASTDSMKHFTVSNRLAKFWIPNRASKCRSCECNSIRWHRLAKSKPTDAARHNSLALSTHHTPPYIPYQLSAHDVNWFQFRCEYPSLCSRCRIHYFVADDFCVLYMREKLKWIISCATLGRPLTEWPIVSSENNKINWANVSCHSYIQLKRRN